MNCQQATLTKRTLLLRLLTEVAFSESAALATDELPDVDVAGFDVGPLELCARE